MINELNQIKAALEKIANYEPYGDCFDAPAELELVSRMANYPLTLVDKLIAVEVNKTENMTDKSVRGA